MGSKSSLLPADFEWGFATAAYQIEGAVAEGGRGKSIWDTFCHLEPTRTKGANGDVACDHYHRYEEDFDLLTKYGAKAYRFSISWSRIIPQGGRNDPLNEEGISFYSRLIDSLLKRGITPWVTLYHWDLPQALHDRYGGWLDVQESQLDFERYARVCYERFGDRVKNWITLNEPWIQSIFGYSTGGNAPGRSSTNDLSDAGNSATEPWIVGKAQILSHVRAVIAYNKDFKPSQGGQIGISLNGDYYEPWDSADSRDKEAAERRMEFHIGWFANPIFLKKDYPSCMREQLGDRLPLFTESEVALLEEAETDFYGMNYYTSQFARHRGEPASDTDFVGNLDELQQDKQGTPVGEESGLHWLRSCPDLFRKHLTRVYNLYGKPIYITENGCPCPGEDKMTCDEAVNDPYRIKYFSSHLDAICKSIVDDGAVIKGYFAWALLDNLGAFLSISQVFVANRFTEWSDGYGPRFGVTFTDYKTLKRTPKQSALLLRKMVTDRQGLSVTTS
ncbi:Beta-glucosidase 1B [Metarhizium brunneum]|uniref:beta-glucosidase n=1 Tax=Metarhizium brunneum TaxID=500148 RepID=A0A7D5UVK9_9HYPO